MSTLYNVYLHPKRGQWGFTALTLDGDVRTAAIDTQGRVLLGKVDAIQLAPALQQRLRAGYQRMPQPKYLLLASGEEVQRGEFVAQHPDLGASLNGELLFFVSLPPGADMAQVAQSWCARLEQVDGNARERQQWLLLCSRATDYVPLKSGDIHAALIAAQWARENQLVLVSSAGELPGEGPAEQRHDWRHWLTAWFPQGVIDRALADLGWPLDDAVSRVEPLSTSSTASTDQDGWLALARQVCF